MAKRRQAMNGLYECPCCGYATLSEPSRFEICEICFWEDDGQDDDDRDTEHGGPNHVSLTEARFNYLVYGAAEQKDLEYVRAPGVDDISLRHYKIVYDVVPDETGDHELSPDSD